MNAKLKEHAVLPKDLKPTKQRFDPLPSVFRNGWWLHDMLNLEYADFHRTLEGGRAPPKAIAITRATIVTLKAFGRELISGTAHGRMDTF